MLAILMFGPLLNLIPGIDDGPESGVSLIFLFLPLLDLIALVVVNQKATKVLRQNGIRVGFLGARLADIRD